MHSASVVLPEPACPSKAIFFTWVVSNSEAIKGSLKVRQYGNSTSGDVLGIIKRGNG
jgi:hypothetical protein